MFPGVPVCVCAGFVCCVRMFRPCVRSSCWLCEFGPCVGPAHWFRVVVSVCWFFVLVPVCWFRVLSPCGGSVCCVCMCVRMLGKYVGPVCVWGGGFVCWIRALGPCSGSVCCVRMWGSCGVSRLSCVGKLLKASAFEEAPRGWLVHANHWRTPCIYSFWPPGRGLLKDKQVSCVLPGWSPLCGPVG